MISCFPLGIEPEVLDVVVISHAHQDHSGGLEAFLRQNHDVTVYLPQSLGAALKKAVKNSGAELVDVRAPMELFEDAYSTGELGSRTRAQANSRAVPLLRDSPSRCSREHLAHRQTAGRAKRLPQCNRFPNKSSTNQSYVESLPPPKQKQSIPLRPPRQMPSSAIMLPVMIPPRPKRVSPMFADVIAARHPIIIRIVI